MKLATLFRRVSPERARAVREAPATFNRKARREAGLLGKFWKWDSEAMGLDPQLPPRYVRRHWAASVLTHPKTRRQRRHKARILKAMKGRRLV